MKFRTVLHEALLNVRTGTARTTVWALVFMVFTVGLIGLDISAVRQLDREARAFEDSGATVKTLSAPGHIDGARCEALNSVPGVRAAGALRKAADLHAVKLPTTGVPTYEVSPHVVGLLLRDTPSAPLGVVLSEEAAETLGVRTGDFLHTDLGDTRIAAVYDYPDDGRIKAYSFAALSRVPAMGAFDECWVDQWPSSPDLAPLLRATLAAGGVESGVNIVGGQLNSRPGTALDANARFVARLTAWAPTVAFLAGWMIGFAAIRVRRLELTSLLHQGVSRRALAGLVLAESTAWWAPTFLVGVALALGFARTGAPEDLLPSLVIVIGPTMAATLGAILGVLFAALALREDRLFDHFKAR